MRAKLVDAMDGLIRDAVIVGENAPQLGALLWLSERAQAMEPATRDAALLEKLSAFAAISTGSASRIRRAAILPAAPSLDAGEITEKGSLNQRALRANNAGLIADLYEGKPGSLVV
jgi:feruloyl-CoA synthase